MFVRLMMILLNRYLGRNQLSGTIPSPIGSLVNLQELYVNSICSHHHETSWSTDDTHTLDTWWWRWRFHWTDSSPRIDWPAPFHHRLALSWISRACTSIVQQIFIQRSPRNLDKSTIDDTHSPDHCCCGCCWWSYQQGALSQSTERHHSIIDWLSRESWELVRSIQMICTITRSSIILINRRYSHPRYLMMIPLNRYLTKNRLTGTIPSSIGSLMNLTSLYVNRTTNIHSTSPRNLDNQQSTILTLQIIAAAADDDHINRELSYNQLSGTIPSSIGSLVNLENLYAQSKWYAQ